MKLTLSALRAGMALACVVAAPPALALLTSQTIQFSGVSGLSVADTLGGGATAGSGTAGSSSLMQFDPAQGVLIGAGISVTSSTLHQRIDVGGVGGGGLRTASGVGNATIDLAAPGFAQQLAAGTISGSCSSSGGNCSGLTITHTTTSPIPSPAAVNAAALDAYVGTGTVSPTTTAAFNATSSGTKVNVTSTYTVGWNGEGAVSYDYMLHALAGLSALTLDFGTVNIGDVAMLGFDIFNAGGERVGLDLDAFDAFGGPFGTDLAVFDGLAAGAGLGFHATMDTSAAGTFGGTYRLFFSDADVGAASSRHNDSLLLTLTGAVVAGSLQAAAVPEPELPALLGIGFAALALARRRRRADAA